MEGLVACWLVGYTRARLPASAARCDAGAARPCATRQLAHRCRPSPVTSSSCSAAEPAAADDVLAAFNVLLIHQPPPHLVQRGGAGGGGRRVPPLSDAACQGGRGCHHAGGRDFVDLLCLHLVGAGSWLCVRATMKRRARVLTVRAGCARWP